MVSKTRTASSRPDGDGSSTTRSGDDATTQYSGGTRSDRQSTSHRKPVKPKNLKKKPNRKKKKSKKKGLWWKILLGVIGVILVAGIALFAYLYITTDIPQPESIALSEKTSVYYSDGTTKIGSFEEQNREIIDCSTLPSYVGDAIVSSEDRTFYTNKGIDLGGIMRALYNNLTTGSRQGGSTITQQYAERYYLGETTSYSGKLREAILAIKIAQQQDKSTVLCNYMNTIYLGRGAYGIQAAAQAYFGKDAKDLTVSEAAMIAGIIPSPSTWDPAINEKQAESRFERVIRIMKEDGYITDEQASDAKFPEVKDYTVSNDFSGPNGYLLTTVENELVNSGAFTKDELETGGYKIVTTLDKDMQSEMQTVGDNRPDDMPDSIEVGGIAVDQTTGGVKAMYGGSDYLTKQLNNATQATFQPGSTMKPFGLLGAAQDDVSFSTLFNGNSGLTFETQDGVYAQVPNALNKSYGYINLYTATAKSVNTVFMNVNEHLTSQKFAEIAKEAGITSDIDADTLYNILGINSITVWDLAQGHSTIANNGTKNTLHVVDKVTKDDKTMYTANPNTTEVFDANDCELVQQAMLGTTTTGGTAPTIQSALGREVAGKSGTANDETAASFVGYTPQLLNVWAIWNPADDGSAQVVPSFSGYGVSSTGYPSHLFQEFMSQALANYDVETFTKPTDTGKIGGPDGDWGLGGSTSSSSSGTQSTAPSTENNNDYTDQDTNTTSGGSGSGDDDNESTTTTTETPEPTATATTPAPTQTASPETETTPTTPSTSEPTDTGTATPQSQSNANGNAKSGNSSTSSSGQ
ncbi:transglycosylase domain-containing protein [Bifidobacterium choloepi]|uniref:Penicillin-binding protein n=1 Tax=Bifidobacterium choloepi TaxID=2614131 RepID=A0A6I5MZY2_9BIFI|nr:transglycosylase domain-containing protein [Bifidobacterium choloepi]NEG69827.1 penicillin-binding protein [Bifidobacterium choloepi]